MMVAAEWIPKSADLQQNLSNLIWRNSIMQQDNDTEHTNITTKDFITGKVVGFKLTKSVKQT